MSKQSINRTVGLRTLDGQTLSLCEHGRMFTHCEFCEAMGRPEDIDMIRGLLGMVQRRMNDHIALRDL